VQHDHAEMIVIPLDRSVEIRHCDAHVVDSRDQGRGEDWTGVNLIGGHNAKVT
jgi:hypothetical protein